MPTPRQEVIAKDGTIYPQISCPVSTENRTAAYLKRCRDGVIISLGSSVFTKRGKGGKLPPPPPF